MDENTILTIGAVIEQCEKRRLRLGLSYAELARRLGVSRAYVSKLMSGRQNISIASLSKLAAVLDARARIELIPSRPATRAAVIIRGLRRGQRCSLRRSD